MLIAIGSAILLVLTFVVGIFGNFVRRIGRGTRPRWVRVDVKGPLPARPQPRRGWLAPRPRPSLAELDVLLRRLAADPRIAGIVVRLIEAPGGWARLAALREVLARPRAAGKRVVVHLSSPTQREYLVATAADTILLDESGHLPLTGIAAQAIFLGGALEKLGVHPEVAYRGKYKSMAEMWSRDSMSEAQREATDAILDGVAAQAAGWVAEGRGVSAERAAELLAGGPYTAAAAAGEALGLVDGVCYLDEVGAWLDARKPEGAPPVPKEVPAVSSWLRWSIRPLRVPHPLRRRQERVRVIALHGTIVGGEGGGWPRPSLGAEAALRALEGARKDPRVGAVVLHVDSPGGSAPASDLMWRAVVRLGEDKPVVACFDDVAASGGYYLAAAAKKIVARPGTITGSIGVVAGKLDASRLLARVGLRVEHLVRGPAAAMWSPARGLSEDERRRFEADVDAFYAQFVRKVAAGRGRSEEQIHEVAQGRVWLGPAAQAAGLVDVLGGVDEAIALARELAGLPAPRAIRPGPPRTPFPGDAGVDDVSVAPHHRGMLGRLLGRAVAAPATAGDAGGDLLGVLALARDSGSSLWAILPVSWRP